MSLTEVPGRAGLLVSGAHDGTVRVWEVAAPFTGSPANAGATAPRALYAFGGYKVTQLGSLKGSGWVRYGRGCAKFHPFPTRFGSEAWPPTGGVSLQTARTIRSSCMTLGLSCRSRNPALSSKDELVRKIANCHLSQARFHVPGQIAEGATGHWKFRIAQVN